MSIGYELKITPLQVLAFYNAIANDGQRMRPRFVKEIRNRGRIVESFEPEEVGGRLCSRSTLKKIQEMLEGVVENGTARNIRTDKYRIAGKTGTARIATGTKGYGIRKYRASFVGFFPAEAPLYSCIVVIDNPSLSKGFYAAQVSSPVFREIADKVYSIAYMQYGEQQRVAIARALIAGPDVIFADEPTGNLDSRSGAEVMKMLGDIRRRMNKTLVVITHDSRIAQMAERRLVIMDGILTEEGVAGR